MKQHFRLDTHPVADPANVVQGDRYRITVLDAGLVRLEYAESGTFEDRASQTVREPRVRAERLHGHRDRRRAAGDPHRPAAPDLRQGPVHHARPVGAGQGRLPLATTRCGATGSATPNLGGTARTLDDVDGAIPLEHGVLAFDGVAMVDDSRTVLLERRRLDRPAPRRATSTSTSSPTAATTSGALEALYDADRPALRCCRATRSATGGAATTPTPPTSTSTLMDRFADEQVPFSVAVHRHGLAPGRHRPERTAAAGPATPGTPSCSPTRRGFLAELHERGLATSLNVHPAEGVHAHEDGVPGDRRSGWASTRPPSCRSASTPPTRDFLEAYLEELHHPLEDEGVDFWWLDWQQGGVTKMPGLDPLWLLNHFHFLDSGPRRAAAADVLALRRHRQPPLPDRLLRRHPHHLGVAGLPALLHRDRVERRLRLVEPRHRRPLQGLPRRRARHPVGAARRVLAGQPAALGPQPVQHQGAVAVPGRRARR